MSTDIIRNFAVAGTVLGTISTAMGILTICFGPKALKDWIVDMYKRMWWQPVFGNLRYQWIVETMENYVANQHDATQIETPLRYVLNTWNPDPKDMRLLSLFKAVWITRRSGGIYPIDLICKCALSIHGRDLVPWSIVETMRQRMISDDMLHIRNTPLRCKTMCRLHARITRYIHSYPGNIAFNVEIPHQDPCRSVDMEGVERKDGNDVASHEAVAETSDKSDQIIDGEIRRVRTDIQCHFEAIKTKIYRRLQEADVSVAVTAMNSSEDAWWVVLRNMASLLLSIYNSMGDEADVTHITFREHRSKLFFALLPDDPCSGILWSQLYHDSSILNKYITDHFTIDGDKATCNCVV